VPASSIWSDPTRGNELGGIIGMTRLNPLPDRGGPISSIQPSTDAQQSTPRLRPSR
jgi:hypothetical protein